MKRFSFCTAWLGIALLLAGCGQEPASQPGSAPQPGERGVAPVEQPAATEPGQTEEPAAEPEEPVAPPEVGIPEDSMPPLEGPALSDPAPAAPAASESPPDEPSPSPPAEERTGAPPAGEQKSVLGAVSESLFRAATGRTSSVPPPNLGDAPGYDGPAPR